MAIRDHDQRYGVTPPLVGFAKLANDLDCASADDYAMADVEGRARPVQAVRFAPSPRIASRSGMNSDFSFLPRS